MPTRLRAPQIHIGTAGWSIPRALADAFPGEGQHLDRYARVLNCAEINTSFYRPHRTEVYARWAAQTPAGFRFAAKLPRAITHDARLRAARVPLQLFIAEVSGLGDRLAVLLVQLPPSLVFEPRPVRRFFALLGDLYGGAVICEPRHASWFTPAAGRLLAALRVGRAASDPALVAEAAVPGGWLGDNGDGAGAVLYHRWHGSPRMYRSSYGDAWIRQRAIELRKWPAAADCWAVFDNTAAGAAASNALALKALLHSGKGLLPDSGKGTGKGIGKGRGKGSG